jgi:hypothetical protein
MAKQTCRHISCNVCDWILDTDGNVPTRWHALYYVEVRYVLPPFQIIRCFGFSKYIAFIMYLDIVHI